MAITITHGYTFAVTELVTNSKLHALVDDAVVTGDFDGCLIMKVLAESVSLTTGDGKMYLTIPAQLDGFILKTVGAHVYTVSSSGTPTIQIHNYTDGVDMLSTPITIDANEKDSSTAATAAVIDSDNRTVAEADEIRIDVDVAGTGAKGLEVRLSFEPE